MIFKSCYSDKNVQKISQLIRKEKNLTKNGGKKEKTIENIVKYIPFSLVSLASYVSRGSLVNLSNIYLIFLSVCCPIVMLYHRNCQWAF